LLNLRHKCCRKPLAGRNRLHKGGWFGWRKELQDQGMQAALPGQGILQRALSEVAQGRAGKTAVQYLQLRGEQAQARPSFSKKKAPKEAAPAEAAPAEAEAGDSQPSS
jgi:hypothetical protein